MNSMFFSAGEKVTTFDLNLSNWDVSKVTNMFDLFENAGYKATAFTLDLSSWDTSSATNMDNMFSGAGYNAKTWSVKIPKITGSLTNTTSRLYGSSDSVYAYPRTGFGFTLAT